MSDLLKKNWMNESLSAGSSMGQTAYDNEGLNGQTPMLNIDVATNPIADNVSGGNMSKAVSKNQSNAGNMATYAQMGAGAVAVGSSLLNYGKVKKEYDNTLESMGKAIDELSQGKTDISTSLFGNTNKLKSDFSENIQNNAIGVLEKNKNQLMSIQNKGSDFQSGNVQRLKSESLSSISKVLNTTFKNQQIKMNNLIDENVDAARVTTQKLSADIENVENKMKEVRKAKKNQGLNILKDFTAYASLYLDPTGTSKDIIQSTKFENEYT